MAGSDLKNQHSQLLIVDRDEELTKLTFLLEQAIAGTGNTVFIVGEAGIGKTRLIDVLADHATANNVVVLKARCPYGETLSTPYLPFTDILRQYFQSCRMTANSEFGKQEPEAGLISAPMISGEPLPMCLLPLFGDQEQKPELDLEKIQLERDRERLMSTICELIVNISRTSPLLIFIDDLQWIDKPSALLFHNLARGIQSSRVLLCAAYRPEEIRDLADGKEHPVAELRRMLEMQKLHTVIQLKPLNQEQIAELTRAMLECRRVPEKFLRFLYRESDGNPLIVSEMLRALIAERKIVVGRELIPDFEQTEFVLPGSIKQLALRRFMSLDENAKNVLMWAAVLGDLFEFEQLYSIIQVDDETLLTALDKLLEMKLVREERAKGEVYAFENKQLRAVAYDEFVRPKADLMHRKVGEWLEKTYKEKIDEVIYSLAYHFIKANETLKAFKYALAAGDKAARSYAIDEALDYYRAALTAVNKLGAEIEPDRKIGLLVRLGDVNFLAGRLAQAMEYLKSAAELAEKSQSDELAADTYRKLGNVSRAEADYQSSIQYFQRSLAIAERISSRKYLMRACLGLGSVYFRMGDYDKAIEYNERCMKYMEGSVDHADEAKHYSILGDSYYSKGDYQKAIGYYTRSLQLYEALGNIHEVARIHMFFADIYRLMEDWNKSVEESEKCCHIAEKIGYTRMIGYGLLAAVPSYCEKGQLKTAETNLQRATEIFESSEDALGTALATFVKGMVHRYRGEYAQALQFMTSIKDMFEILATPFWQGLVHEELSITYMKTGERAKAREECENALRIWKKLGNIDRLRKTEMRLQSILAVEKLS